MTIEEKLHELRRIMVREDIYAYIISGTDPHQSEYLPSTWQQRNWFSGFTGSFGTVVVTEKEAGLWTDSRYFIQAEKELKNSGIKLHKLRVPGAVDFPEWLSENVPSGENVGFDEFCTSKALADNLKNLLNKKDIKAIGKHDLLGEFWIERPGLPENKIFTLDKSYTGESTSEKLARVREFLYQNNADYILFSELDDIAWLYNFRGNDIEYNPVAICYAFVGKDTAKIFIKKNKVPKQVAEEFSDLDIEIVDYHHVGLFIDELNKESKICLDYYALNFAIYNKFANKCSVINIKSPIKLWKSIKNPVEIQGFKAAFIKDGVALTKFYHWLESELKIRSISELEAEEKLIEYRKEQSEYMGDSFHYISAYGKNAASPHYTASSKQFSMLENKGLFLMDSGAHYKHGTTDITRTISLGELTKLEREDYTLVFKGMINLSNAVFLEGTLGTNLDILARQFLWRYKRNYGHGTGHGVGYFLNVHEGPQELRMSYKNQAFIPGMITSNEPGMYRENMYGIRHENLNLCIKEGENEFGSWLAFEPLTLCYFDTLPLVMELMDKSEIEWLNRYHKNVFDKISPYLDEDDKNWLKEKTKAIYY